MEKPIPITEALRQELARGLRRLGELEFQAVAGNTAYHVCHWQDRERLDEPALDGLTVHEGPAAARELAMYSADGAYRFAKAETNLRRGWVLRLQSVEELRQALDLFYPAALGLYLALRRGDLEVEHLRAKLDRQTGMFRFARHISDAGAQQLVRDVCGPAHQCAKRILWQLDPATPLNDSPASRFNGIPTTGPEAAAIPLLCREACNHFVAECRRVAKDEAAAAGASGSQVAGS